MSHPSRLFVDTTDRPILAMGTDYPRGMVLESHAHRRAQFLYGATGLMEVETTQGCWVVPPQCGVWIPATIPHRVRMDGVSTRSLYIEPAAAPRTRLEVLHVAPLLRQLLLDAVDIPAEYEIAGRDGALMQLLLFEVARANPLPFFAPLPRNQELARMCSHFLKHPYVHAASKHWAGQLHKSERTFSRLFRQETGMAFGEWKQQACLLMALSMLAAGKPVTTVALDLGYDSPGAFSTMFRKRLGRTPSSVLQR